jgi:glycosyltransferase involved in cell wall biosynthesis
MQNTVKEPSSNPMKISVITCTYNNVNTVERALLSVLNQNHKDVDYVVIDGGSTDGTLDVLNKYSSQFQTFISEPDEGLYDALNKGIRHAKGEYIGFLHSDDFFITNEVVSKIEQFILSSSKRPAGVSGEMVYFAKEGSRLRIHRRYSTANFKPWQFRFGVMPGHTASFIQKSVYEKYGLYRTDFRIAADFDLLVKLIAVERLDWSYSGEVWIAMGMGGISTANMQSNFLLSKEIEKLLKEKNIWTHPILLYSKYIFKFSRKLYYNLRKKYLLDWTSAFAK